MLDEQAKKLGAIHKIEVTDENDLSVIGYLKKMDRTTYSAVVKILETDRIKANETLLRTLLIKEVSDMRLVDDDDIFLSVLPQLSNIIVLKKSKLTSL
jgi:hypothetical protein